MATLDTIAHRSTGSQIAGKAYFETSTNKFIVFNGTAWIELDSDGTGAAPFENRWGANFNGGNHLLMGTSAISLDTNFTISAWFKPNSSALAGYDTICGWGNNASGESRIMQILDSKLSFEIYFSRVSGSTTLSADTWYHGAVTFSGNDVEIFLNGSSDGTGTLSRSSMASSLTFAGGTAPMAGSGFTPFSGLIDEFAVFNSVLSSSDISSIYNGGNPTDISSLNPVGWWRMGDHSNDSATAGGNIATITDSSGNGNDATQSTASKQPTFAQHESLSRVTTKFDLYYEHLEAYPTSDTDIYGLSAFIYFENDVVPTSVQGVAFAVSTSPLLGVGGNLTGAVSDELLLVYKGAAFAYTDSSGSIPKGWHHVMLAWSPTSQINPGSPGYDIYLDGVVVGNTTSTQYGSPSLFTIKSNLPLIVGQRGDGTFGMTTKMDDVAIFDSQLSSSDITSIYNNGVPGDISALNPAGWWRMGDDDSLAHDAVISQITDQSGNGLHLVQNAANHFKPTAHHISTIYV